MLFRPMMRHKSRTSTVGAGWSPSALSDIPGSWFSYPECRCIFCGWYGLTVRDLVIHFDRNHGRVV